MFSKGVANIRYIGVMQGFDVCSLTYFREKAYCLM